MRNGGSAPVGFHLVRYGTPADQRYLLRPFLETYDQIVINANIVALMPAALAAFLSQHAKGKSYFLDPQTHAFQHDPTNLEARREGDSFQIRKSIQNLLNRYGDPAATAVESNHRGVRPNDFPNPRVIERFCQRVLQFQRNAIAEQANQSDAAKYFKFLEKKGKIKAPKFTPAVLVAPYFCMKTSTFHDWIDINIACARSSIGDSGGDPIAVEIALYRDLLTNETLRANLIEKYRTLKPATFLVWIDGFSEHDAAGYELEALVRLFNGLGMTAPVVNLYGGFFSVALKRLSIVPALAGICHGLEYGESREFVPVGGGMPVAKFYYPSMHKRLPFRDALRAVRAQNALHSAADFHRIVCACDECKAVIRTNPDSDFAAYGRTRPISFMRRNQPIAKEFPLPETRDHCVNHYMWCKDREYNHNLLLIDLIRDLDVTHRLGRNLGLETVAYAEVWRSILEAARDQT